MKKTAVIVFNLGGPDQLSSVEPFLFNLFKDRAIIDLPNPLRWLLARFISYRRGPVARKIYDHMGGKSPLLDMTRDQARALEQTLNQTSDQQTFKTFIAMRYWHPMSGETASQVVDYNPDHIVLLPLYPQYSTTTTGSSITDWQQAADNAGLVAPTDMICCYPKDPGWINAQCDLISKALESCDDTLPIRILFSAHGLPKKIIEKGDPYQWQIEQTCAGILDGLKGAGKDHLDHAICYQSRVGRLEWIGPSLDTELRRAAKHRVGVVVVPIAFVSEHSETLVELDIEYRDMARDLGIVDYVRVSAVATHDSFIKGLAGLVHTALQNKSGQKQPYCCGGDCRCQANHSQCPNKI